MLFLYEMKSNAFKTLNDMTIKDSLIIGFIQGIAIMPGISRSGSTIATARLRGINKETAATFSFLLSLPAISGAFLLQLKDVIKNGEEINLTLYGIGFIVSFITGYFSLRFLIWMIKKANLKFFAFYCLLLGLFAIIFA